MYISEVINDNNIQVVGHRAVAEKLLDNDAIGTAHVALTRKPNGEATRLLVLRLDVIGGIPIVSSDFFHLKDTKTVGCQTPEFSVRSVSFFGVHTDPNRVVLIADVAKNSEALDDHTSRDRVVISFRVSKQGIDGLVFNHLGNLRVRFTQTEQAIIEPNVFRRVSIGYSFDLPVSSTQQIVRDTITELLSLNPGDEGRDRWLRAMSDAGFRVVSEPRLAGDKRSVSIGSPFGATNPEIYKPAEDCSAYFGIHPLDFNFHFTDSDYSAVEGYPKMATTYGFDAPPGSGPVRRAATFFAIEIFNRCVSGIAPVPDDERRLWLFRRMLVYSIMHEFGHMLNLFHPWERDLQLQPKILPDGSDLTWTNYGYYYPFGALSRKLKEARKDLYDQKRHARMNNFLDQLDRKPGYSQNELVHIRHERHNLIAPGPVSLATAHNHKLGTETASDYTSDPLKTLELLLETDTQGQSDAEVTALRYRAVGFTPDQLRMSSRCGWDRKQNIFLYPFAPIATRVRLVNKDKNVLVPSGDLIRNQFAIQSGALRLIVKQDRTGTDYFHTQGPTLQPDIPEPAAFLGYNGPQLFDEESYAMPPLRPDYLTTYKTYTVTAVLILPPYGYIKSETLTVHVDNDAPENISNPQVFDLLRDPNLLQLHYAVHEYSSLLGANGQALDWARNVLAKIEDASAYLKERPSLRWVSDLAKIAVFRTQVTGLTQNQGQLDPSALRGLAIEFLGENTADLDRLVSLSILNSIQLKTETSDPDVQNRIIGELVEFLESEQEDGLEGIQNRLRASSIGLPEINRFKRRRTPNL